MSRWDARHRHAYYVISALFSLAAVIQILDLLTRLQHHDSVVEPICAIVISVAAALSVGLGARRAT